METTTTTNSLQLLIEARAKAKLNKDLIELSESVLGNRLLSQNYDCEVPTVIYREKENNFRQLFWVNGKHIQGVYLNDLFESWYPVYVKEETDAFVNKVDFLQEQIEELKSVNHEQGYD